MRMEVARVMHNLLPRWYPAELKTILIFYRHALQPCRRDDSPANRWYKIGRLSLRVSTMLDQPPLLPAQWFASYVSYWQPMAPGDEITSGSCWFDYGRKAFRIDRLFNPWDKSTGYRLWMSEIGFYGEGKTRKYRRCIIGHAGSMPRSRSASPAQSTWWRRITDSLYHATRSAFRGDAVRIENHLGPRWRWLVLPAAGGARSCHIHLQAGTHRLLRMVTGDPTVRASIRDFPIFRDDDLPQWVFDPPAGAVKIS